MTTQEWIAKNYQSNYSTGYRFNSVMMSGGNLYSYGYHYPLLFRIGGKDFINVAGYSMTTSKHIGWAWDVATDAIPVVLPSGYNIDNATIDDMVKLLKSEMALLIAKMATKQRKNTKLYIGYQSNLDKLVEYINQLTEVAVA